MAYIELVLSHRGFRATKADSQRQALIWEGTTLRMGGAGLTPLIGTSNKPG